MTPRANEVAAATAALPAPSISAPEKPKSTEATELATRNGAPIVIAAGLNNPTQRTTRLSLANSSGTQTLSGDISGAGRSTA